MFALYITACLAYYCLYSSITIYILIYTYYYYICIYINICILYYICVCINICILHYICVCINTYVYYIIGISGPEGTPSKIGCREGSGKIKDQNYDKFVYIDINILLVLILHDTLIYIYTLLYYTIVFTTHILYL